MAHSVLHVHNIYLGFREFPDEITMALNIAGCPLRCVGCHSPWLQNDDDPTAAPLTASYLDHLLEGRASAVTCVGLFGGDQDVASIADAVHHIKTWEGWKGSPGVKVGWYSGVGGRLTDGQLNPASIGDPDTLELLSRYLDYLKEGPYIQKLGGLDHKTTNQKMYRNLGEGEWENITSRFWQSPTAR
jgi:anaerobic ribonucleoside-triphosphate reductase activating protein